MPTEIWLPQVDRAVDIGAQLGFGEVDLVVETGLESVP
jgi:hypothetical protein